MRGAVAYARGEPDAGNVAVKESLLDAHLLRQFPGRTLDELDQMDWARYLRAIEIDRIVAIEARRQQFLDGHIAPDAMTPDDWLVIQEHDQLMQQHTTRIDD